MKHCRLLWGVIRRYTTGPWTCSRALGILTIFSFWPALLAGSALVLVGSLYKQPYAVLMGTEFVHLPLYVAGYGAFTIFWMQTLKTWIRKSGQWRWWRLLAFGGPLLFMTAAETSIVLRGYPIKWVEILAAICGIAAAAVIRPFIWPGARKKTSNSTGRVKADLPA